MTATRCGHSLSTADFGADITVLFWCVDKLYKESPLLILWCLIQHYNDTTKSKLGRDNTELCLY